MNGYAKRVTPRHVAEVKSFRFWDLLVIFLCLLTAAGGVYFFCQFISNPYVKS
jgi:hypothetical protein